MEATLLEQAVDDKRAVDLFEALLRLREDETSPVPDAVFALDGIGRFDEETHEMYPVYTVKVSAPDEQAKFAMAFATGFIRAWCRCQRRRRRYHVPIRRRRFV